MSKIAFVFPGQASQFAGMGKEIYNQHDEIKTLFHKANETLGFNLSEIMFEGTDEELKQTKVTQPSVFLFSYAQFLLHKNEYTPSAVAGHSLGEITALAANGSLTFEDALQIVKVRAEAMQKACELEPSTMSAIVGLKDEEVEKVCETMNASVIPANYNCPGQIVISGGLEGIEKVEKALQEAGAKRVIRLAVGGAFHSPYMEPAAKELQQVIDSTSFHQPSMPIYQNVSGKAVHNPEEIKTQLLQQLTAPVRWTQIMNQMVEDGIDEIVEFGGKTLSGFFKRVDRRFPTTQKI